MSTTQVSNLHIYPIKSIAGISLSSATVTELGLNEDRRFVLSDPSGEFITARTEPKLCLVQSKLSHQGISLIADDMPELSLMYDQFSNQYQDVNVWGDKVSGQICSDAANQWFSDYLKRPCQLIFFGEHSFREKKANTENARKVAFADGYPLLLISQSSLDDLNERLSSKQLDQVSMANFRPNIVVQHSLAFEEDTWQHIRIGEVEFIVSKPCERCIFTTVNPKTGEKHPERQPLKTLQSYRQNEANEVLFGQNLIPLNEGIINQGDPIVVLSKKVPPAFQTTTEESVEKTINPKKETNTVPKKLTVHFEKWNKSHQSKETKTLLEHGEDAGLILPYSCRAGMCGRCKAKLISGDVKQATTDGLMAQEIEDGYILCCASTAQTDIVIKHD